MTDAAAGVPDPASAPGSIRIAARGIGMRFGGIKALDGVDFAIEAGRVHALCGENGAGKSTLIKILAGYHPHGSFEGSIFLDGQESRFRGPRDAERAGLAVIYQELALVDRMTVAENLFLGDLPTRGGLVDWPRLMREAGELLRRFAVGIGPEAAVGTLGIGRRQQVEILKAVRKRSKILILDEPTAALGEPEAQALLGLVRRLAGEGVACMYITHRLDEIRAVADRVTVLRDGRSVAAFPTGAVPAEDLIRAMAGRPVSEAAPRRPAVSQGVGRPLLEVSGLEAAPARGRVSKFSGISFHVRAGEVVGLAGLLGSGRSCLFAHLYGAWGVRRGGTVRVAGEPYEVPTPRRSLARGMALVSEDRVRFGLIPGRSVAFNLTLSALDRLTWRGLIDPVEETRLCRASVESLRVRTAGPEATIRGLSGGNQQKVLLARALLTEPRILLLDEPTRGVDVATKFEIYELIRRMTDRGKAVLLATSELPELLGLSDRVLVLRGGQIASEFPRAAFDEEGILAAALGHETRSGDEAPCEARSVAGRPADEGE